jgi:outer membrane lipoprotein-sorting protein
MRKIATSIILMIACQFAFASSLHPLALSKANYAAFDSVQQKLAATTYLTGNFIQTRRLQVLSRPLIARGRFVFSRKQGLQWYQTSPFESSLVVTQDKIEQKIGDAPASILTKEKQPIVFAFTNIFLAIFNGNIDEVKQYFKISFAGSDANWQINLKPNTFPLNKGIKTIILKGTATLNSLTIIDTKKNQTHIQLSNLKGSQA